MGGGDSIVQNLQDVSEIGLVQFKICGFKDQRGGSGAFSIAGLPITRRGVLQEELLTSLKGFGRYCVRI